MLLVHRRLGPKWDSEKTARIIHSAQRTSTRFAWFPILTWYPVHSAHLHVLRGFPFLQNRKKKDNARSVEGKWENHREQRQCQTKHDWNDAGDGDDKNRVQMTNDERDDANDSQALTGGDITKYSTHQ